MNQDVIITCAVTGAGPTQDKHPDLPITPRQIADACIESANAGAAITHIHVRDPQTGEGCREHRYFEEVVDHVRASGVDVVVNLTTGMGGDYVVGDEVPTDPGPGTDFVMPEERVSHIDNILPEICSLGLRHHEFRQQKSVDGEYTRSFAESGEAYSTNRSQAGAGSL